MDCIQNRNMQDNKPVSSNVLHNTHPSEDSNEQNKNITHGSLQKNISSSGTLQNSSLQKNISGIYPYRCIADPGKSCSYQCTKCNRPSVVDNEHAPEITAACIYESNIQQLNSNVFMLENNVENLNSQVASLTEQNNILYDKNAQLETGIAKLRELLNAAENIVKEETLASCSNVSVLDIDTSVALQDIEKASYKDQAIHLVKDERHTTQLESSKQISSVEILSVDRNVLSGCDTPDSEEVLPCVSDSEAASSASPVTDVDAFFASLDLDKPDANNCIDSKPELKLEEQSTSKKQKGCTSGRNHSVKKDRKFTCAQCGEFFVKLYKLKKHKEETGHVSPNTESSRKSFECEICNTIYKSMRYLRSHQTSSHSGDKQYQCSVCKKDVSHVSVRLLHRTAHLDYNTATTSRIECGICGKVLTSKKGLKEHMIRHEGLKPVKCTLCEWACVSKSEMPPHMAKYHNAEKKFKCPICSKLFAVKLHMKAHLVKHSGAREYVCDFCGADFAYKSALRIHFRRFHSGTQPFKCEYCAKVFWDKYNMDIHVMQRHTGERPHQCEICGKGFVIAKNLQLHMRVHYDPVETREKKFQCEICNRKFERAYYLKAHMYRHSDSRKPFMCSICGKDFISRPVLNVHMRIHTGEKPFECSVCKKTFTQQTNLNRHQQLVHSQLERTHHCPHCDKVFKLASHLTGHIRTHTGERPFQCQMCDKAYKSSNSLKVHGLRMHQYGSAALQSGLDDLSVTTQHNISIDHQESKYIQDSRPTTIILQHDGTHSPHITIPHPQPTANSNQQPTHSLTILTSPTGLSLVDSVIEHGRSLNVVDSQGRSLGVVDVGRMQSLGEQARLLKTDQGKSFAVEQAQNLSVEQSRTVDANIALTLEESRALALEQSRLLANAAQYTILNTTADLVKEDYLSTFGKKFPL